MFDTDSTEQQVVPAGLDEMPPGPALAAFLASIDVDAVSGYDRVVVLRARQRMASHFQGQVYGAMAALADHMEEIDPDPVLAHESAAAEIRAALRLTRRAADFELDLALELRHRLPRVWEELCAGGIDPRRARVLAHGTSHLDIELANDVIDRVIDDAPGMTTGQLAARLRKECIAADPDQANARYRQAMEDRRVVLEATSDGVASLSGHGLPPHRAAAVARRINRIARSLKTSTEPRTIDQLRADVYLDLLAGGHRTAQGGVVDIHVDLETLARLSESPGELAGYGPVVADIAHQVTQAQQHSEWRFTITDPATGLPIHNGITRRRPTTGQRRAVEALHPTCIFPGCRMPATGCDIDHRTPWSEGGPTTIENSAPMCRHDHGTKHHGWAVHPLPGGDHLWISRLGHHYTTSGRPP